MPQTPKLSPQQKVTLVEKIKAGEISRQAAAQSVGVSNTTVRQWLRIYESEGADGLAPREKSRHLTAEEKQAAASCAATTARPATGAARTPPPRTGKRSCGNAWPTAAITAQPR